MIDCREKSMLMYGPTLFLYDFIVASPVYVADANVSLHLLS